MRIANLWSTESKIHAMSQMINFAQRNRTKTERSRTGTEHGLRKGSSLLALFQVPQKGPFYSRLLTKVLEVGKKT